MTLAQAPPPLAAPSFDRSEIQVIPGARLAVRVTGGKPPYVIVPSSSNFDVDFDAVRATLTVAGISNGRGSIAVVDSTGATASIAVLVAPAAGTVPAQFSLTLAGPSVSGDFAAAQLVAGLSRAAHLQEGAALTAQPGAISTLHPGDKLDLRVPVQLHGNERFVDAQGLAAVRVQVLSLPPLDPGELMYSDDPENLTATSDGVLFRDALAPGESARLYLYHASLTGERHLTLALRATAGPVRVQLLGTTVGPSGDYLSVGHGATTQYLRARRAEESVVVDIDPAQPLLLPLSGRPLQPNDLVAAIFDLRLISGGPLQVACVATTGDVAVAPLLDGPRVTGDGHLRTGTFALDAPPLALALRTGQPDPAPQPAGSPRVTPLRAPRPLAGGYGVIQQLTISLDNPGPSESNVYFYEIPNGNAVTTTLFFAGEPAPLEVPCVRTPGVRYLIRRFSLAAGQHLETTAEYMTDGASSYPVLFGLSTVAPATPDGCAAAQSG